MKEYKYYSFSNVDLIDENNIEKDGKNLTIVILSYNKSKLTIRLLDSIKKYMPNFKGKILIFDNHSKKSELKVLRKYLLSFNIDVEIFCSKKNLGIAGGRKKAFSLVKTSWIMSLDNDIYFIANPLKPINECVKFLGAKIINLSIYDDYIGKNLVNGGTLIVNNSDKTYVNVGTLFNGDNHNDKYFLSTGSIGTLVINKDVYQLVGGYDKKFFVGYEDIDFSIRCYRLGLKVGNINKYFLVHNHMFLEDNISKEYEKQRYNTDVLIKSNKHFLKKYNNLYSAMSEYDINFLNKMQEKIKK